VWFKKLRSLTALLDALIYYKKHTMSFNIVEFQYAILHFQSRWPTKIVRDS